MLVGNGVALVGTAMQFGDDKLGKAGDGVIAAGAVLATAFSIVALVKRERRPLPVTVTTQLLAPLVGCGPAEESGYPAWIWRYLNQPLPGAPASIRHQLIEKWTHEKRFSDKGRARRMRLLCAPLHGANGADSDALDDRSDMLADVRDRLAGLSVDLDRLWRDLGERPRPP